MEPIEYQLTQEDLVQFQVFHAERSDLQRRARRRRRNVVVAILMLLALMLYLVRLKFFAVGYLIAGIALYILYPSLFRRMYRRHFTGHVRESQGYLLDGPLTAAVEDDGLYTTSSVGEALHYYSAITDIVENNGTTYIFIGKARAIILPHDRIGKETVDAFLSEVERRREVPAGAQTPEDEMTEGGGRS